MKTLLLVCCAALAAGCTNAAADGSGLPYFDGPDFTPRWSTPANHVIGDFHLVSQTGGAFTRADVDGRVHVASFIYTRCSGVCPMMVSQLKTVQAAIASRPDVLLVSYSVTPADDTPEQLARFGEERGIDPSRWKLVTGDADEIYRLARESYFADDGRLDASQPASEQFLHTEKVLLVDANGRLRGVYNGTLPHEMEKLIQDIAVLRPGP